MARKIDFYYLYDASQACQYLGLEADELEALHAARKGPFFAPSKGDDGSLIRHYMGEWLIYYQFVSPQVAGYTEADAKGFAVQLEAGLEWFGDFEVDQDLLPADWDDLRQFDPPSYDRWAANRSETESSRTVSKA